MKIELKNIKYCEAMSEETNAFTANLYINGKKVGYCRNQGIGGCTDYDTNSLENRKIITKAEKYCYSLPKIKWKSTEFNQKLETVIDQLFEDWLKAKEQKQFEKRMLKAVLVGSPDENRSSYSYYNFRKPLSEIPTKLLQDAVNRIKSKIKNGNVILNTNLKVLGIQV